MKVYRIDRSKYLDSSLTGAGAAKTKGGRWNSFGTKMVYTAECRALATLEVAVHLDLSEDLPTDRHYVSIHIPADVEVLEVAVDDLPADWNAKPPNSTTQAIGDDFVQGGKAAVLKVPSSFVPGEYNYLLNPDHPQCRRIKVTAIAALVFDTRLKMK